MVPSQLEKARRLLCSLQDAIRDAVVVARARSSAQFARISGVTSADTIYEVDRISEDAIFDWFESHWPKTWPVEIVMEGLEEGEGATFPRGTAISDTAFKCIIDPIDGTRGIMYDKRSAWILTGLAPQRGPSTDLRDICVAAMTELPTSKQWRADQFSVIRGAGRKGIVAHGFDLRSRRRQALTVAPSRAKNFEHGFASLVKFFPPGKAATAQLEERLWEQLHGKAERATPVVFDDQYISTGGQLYELLVGHDRMVGDLRPLIFTKLKLSVSLTCHPYDICTALIFSEAGGVIEHPDGRPLSGPLDTTTPISWIGYANPTLAGKVRPVLKKLLREFLA